MDKVKNYPPYEEARESVIENGIKSCDEYRTKYKELELPCHPNITYKEEWIDWNTFFGKEKITYPPYEEASKIASEKGIKSYDEYKAKYKELRLPSNPNSTYKEEWIDWPSFMGKDKKSYEEASKIASEKGIKSYDEYKAKYKELGLPSNPKRTYKEEWIDWITFLGKEKKSFPSSYEEAKRRVIEKGIKSLADYRARYKELGLPLVPNYFYRDEWIDWPSFLGKPHKTSHKERTTKVFSKLVLNPILLGDKAPLQIIYMLATNMDKELAEEIELLLKTASFEERLDWVKEQLKTLNVAVPTTPKSKSKTLDSEIPVMESMLGVFEDTFDDLSEEDSTNIQTILENYYHNVINKELIAEYDE